MHYHAEQACNGRAGEKTHSPEFSQVRAMLSARGLPAAGKKRELVARLEAAEFAPGPACGDLGVDDQTCSSGDEWNEGVGEFHGELFSDEES